MEQLQALPLSRKLILGGGILLLIDSFLDWQQVSFGGISGGQSAWHGFWGVVLCLMTIVLLAGAVATMFGVQIPANVPQGLIALALGVLTLLFAIIKVISDDYVHWPAYVGIILAAVVAYGTWLAFQESGEALPNWQQRMTPAGAGSAGTTAPPPAEPPAAPAEPEPPAGDTT